MMTVYRAASANAKVVEQGENAAIGVYRGQAVEPGKKLRDVKKSSCNCFCCSAQQSGQHGDPPQGFD
jgi:hypothetical protein